LAKLKEISELGQTVYTPEGLREFLSTLLSVFARRTGFDLLQLGGYAPVIFQVALEATLNLCHPSVCAAPSLPQAPDCFRDKPVARAVVQDYFPRMGRQIIHAASTVSEPYL
jgi:hypothetical protein